MERSSPLTKGTHNEYAMHDDNADRHAAAAVRRIIDGSDAKEELMFAFRKCKDEKQTVLEVVLLKVLFELDGDTDSAETASEQLKQVEERIKSGDAGSDAVMDMQINICKEELALIEKIRELNDINDGPEIRSVEKMIQAFALVIPPEELQDQTEEGIELPSASSGSKQPLPGSLLAELKDAVEKLRRG